MVWLLARLSFQSLLRKYGIPPPGAHFSTEWGLYSGNDFLGMGCKGNWVEYDFETVVRYIEDQAGNPDLSAPSEESQRANETIDEVKSNHLFILKTYYLKMDSYKNL